MSEMAKVIKIASYEAPRAWLMAPSTYLLDSWNPEVEQIYLQEAHTMTGEFNFSISQTPVILKAHYKKKSRATNFKNKLKTLGPSKNLSDDLVLDLRQNHPDNIAHTMISHVPIALHTRKICQSFDQTLTNIVLPKVMPNYLIQLYQEMGFDVLNTDRPVKAKSFQYNVTPWQAIRSINYQIIGEQLSSTKFSNNISKIAEQFPKKIFISRRKNRMLKNENEVDGFLIEKGYIKVYPEDHNILEQIAMISTAEDIVAVHGAALGPLVFRSMLPAKTLRLVELFNPGHMTNVYRIIAHQTQAKWIAVRGKLWPELLINAYDKPKNPRQFSLDNFEICLTSLALALTNIQSH